MAKCERCGGNGKFYLFSSKEDPCTDCGGSGIDPDTVEDEKESPIGSINEFFFEEVGRSPRPDEVYRFPLWRHPKQAELRDLVDEFEALFTTMAGNYDPLRLVKSPLPMIHYRRERGQSLAFPTGKGFYPSNTTWNHSKGTKQPCDTLIVMSVVPFPLAVYFEW